MSALYKKIEELCKRNQINITAMCRESGASRASLTDLKMGRKQNLSAETLLKIASYFDVSVDYLLETDKAPALTTKDTRDIAKELEAIMQQLDQNGDLMFDGDPMSEEARESIKAAMKLGLEAAKLKNKERFTPKEYRKD